jgi:hypothetical protein
MSGEHCCAALTLPGSGSAGVPSAQSKSGRGKHLLAYEGRGMKKGRHVATDLLVSVVDAPAVSLA